MESEKEKSASTNEEKKKYLRTYSEHVRRIRRIDSEIREIRMMKMCPSMNDDGMPRGSSQSDLSGYAADLDRLEQDMREERYERIVEYKEIARCIKRLSSENEKDVLFYRYIKGMDWWEIAEKMRFSERQIYRLHGKALEHVEIKIKHVSECQYNM